MLLVLFAGAANAASVREQDGNVFFVGDDGASRQLTSQHTDTSPLLSPNGRKVVFLRAIPKMDVNDDPQENEIWLSDISGNDAHRLLGTHPDEDIKKTLTQFNTPVFSADGQLLYFLSAAWATSNALHVLDLATGKEHFVTDANDVLVIGKGRYANHLVVMKHKYFKREGSYDYYWLITPEGKEIRKAGEDKEQAERFIRKQEINHK
ncbi:MAG: hypothetical protein PHQ60_16490 [Sideroxydans sp.]|nr:hypothetical protein [Sideroxydans sp.]